MMFKGRLSMRRWATKAYVVFLVALWSGSASADIVPQTITAYVTETIILPCRITVTVDGELPTVEWSKEKLSRNITLLYRDGCETFGMKNPAFRYRTNLFLNELKDGNISQIIYNLRVSDGGRYQCRTLRGRQWRVHAIVILIVGAVSKPELTVVPTTAGGGVTLECKAECWYPEPEIMFHDDEENEVTAENPTRNLDSTECFTVTRRANLQTPIDSVTCRVHATWLNQTKNTKIYIPAHWMESCTTTAITTGIFSFLTGLIICGIGFFVHKKFCGSRQNSCLSGNGDLNEDVRKNNMMPTLGADQQRLKSKHSGTLQQDQSTHDSRSSPNGTEQVNQHSSYNRSTGQDTSKMKNSGPTVARQDKTCSLLNTDRPRNTSASPSKGTTLRHSGFQRSLSYNASESSESLLYKQ